MPRFRKKPVEITAEQWWPGKLVAGVHCKDGRYYVVTIHKQRVYLEPGDWIVPEGDGMHFYPVKPAVMERTYEQIGS